MSTFRRHRRPFAWIALVAMLALALLPTLSHALAAARGDLSPSWSEVCSADGSRRASLPDGAPAPSLDHLGKHCPFCAHGGVDLAPPSALAFTVQAPAMDARPQLFWHAPSPTFAWRAPAPRGPPQLTA